MGLYGRPCRTPDSLQAFVECTAPRQRLLAAGWAVAEGRLYCRTQGPPLQRALAREARLGDCSLSVPQVLIPSGASRHLPLDTKGRLGPVRSARALQHRTRAAIQAAPTAESRLVSVAAGAVRGHKTTAEQANCLLRCCFEKEFAPSEAVPCPAAPPGRGSGITPLPARRRGR